MEANKPKFFKRLLQVIKPIFRGTLKSLPIAGPIIELSQNIKDEFKGQDKLHAYTSICMQFIGTGLIVYMFFTKQLTIDEVLNYLQKIVELFTV